MRFEHASVEDSRLEITLLAFGILLMVSTFGIVLLACIGRQTSNYHRSSEHGQYTTTKRAGWDEMDRQSFVTALRRRSASLAAEVRREIGTLKSQTVRAVTLGHTMDGNHPAEKSLPRPSADGASLIRGTKMSLLLGRETESVATHFNTPSWTSGRLQGTEPVKHRSSHVGEEDTSCDLEAQEDWDSV